MALTEPLGPLHWLTARVSLLAWRASLTRESPDLAALDRAVNFVTACCPELRAHVAGTWIAESATYIYVNGGPWGVLALYPHWRSLRPEMELAGWRMDLDKSTRNAEAGSWWERKRPGDQGESTP